ncbi:hypothetical protein D3C80_454280 [compost metagenome]
MDALQQGDGHGVAEGVIQFAVGDLLEQLFGGEIAGSFPTEVWELTLFELFQRTDVGRAGGDRQLAFNIGKAFGACGAQAINQLLGNGIVSRAGSGATETILIVDQAGGQQVGIVIVQIVEQVVDVLMRDHHQLHPQIVGETFRQLVVETTWPLLGGEIG